MEIENVVVHFEYEGSIAGSTYRLENSELFLKFVESLNEPSIKIVEDTARYIGRHYFIKIYCTKEEYEVYSRLYGMCYDNFEFVTSSLMYYSLSKKNNYYRLKYVSNEDKEENEEYIKYLEKKDKVDEKCSVGYPDSPLPFLTLAFVVAIVIGFILDKGIGIGAIALYILIVIISLWEDGKNKKEIAKKKDIELKALASVYYGNIAYKKIKREFKK